MVMDFSKLSDDELLSMYNSSKPAYGVDRQSIMGDQTLNNILPNRAIIQDFINKQIYSQMPTASAKTNKQVVNKQPVVSKQAVKTKPANNTQVMKQVTKSVPTETIQQFAYETPEVKQDYINRIEEFAANYPAMVEQDRRRQMQAALLVPVINNDKFVDAAVGQNPIDTTAKQLELLNTAANARVSEAQRPLLAQAFAKAGMPPELAYASDDQLKSIVNLLVATTQSETGRYKAGLDAATRRYVADMRSKGLNAELSLKYGPRGMMKEAMKSMLTPDEYANWLQYMDKAAPAIDRIHSGSPVVTNWGNTDYVVPGETDYFNY